VLYDANQRFRQLLPHPDEMEWVVNAEGMVVENGTGLKFISMFPEFEPGTPGTPWKVATPVYLLYDAFLRLTTSGLEGR